MTHADEREDEPTPITIGDVLIKHLPMVHTADQLYEASAEEVVSYIESALQRLPDPMARLEALEALQADPESRALFLSYRPVLRALRSMTRKQRDAAGDSEQDSQDENADMAAKLTSCSQLLVKGTWSKKKLDYFAKYIYNERTESDAFDYYEDLCNSAEIEPAMRYKSPEALARARNKAHNRRRKKNSVLP